MHGRTELSGLSQSCPETSEWLRLSEPFWYLAEWNAKESKNFFRSRHITSVASRTARDGHVDSAERRWDLLRPVVVVISTVDQRHNRLRVLPGIDDAHFFVPESCASSRLSAATSIYVNEHSNSLNENTRYALHVL